MQTPGYPCNHWYRNSWLNDVQLYIRHRGRKHHYMDRHIYCLHKLYATGSRNSVHIRVGNPSTGHQNTLSDMCMIQHHAILYIWHLAHKVRAHMVGVVRSVQQLKLFMRIFMYNGRLIYTFGQRHSQPNYQNVKHNLTWCQTARWEWISLVARQTRAHWLMVDDCALRVESAGSDAWVSTLVVQTCQFGRTVSVDQAFGPTIWWCAQHAYHTTTHRPAINCLTLWIRSTRWRTAWVHRYWRWFRFCRG